VGCTAVNMINSALKMPFLILNHRVRHDSPAVKVTEYEFDLYNGP
jgi:hypothetical protein